LVAGFCSMNSRFAKGSAMRPYLLTLILVPTFALGAAWLLPAQAQVAGVPLHPPTDKDRLEAKKKARQGGPGQIACTITGCHRIPPGCHPEMGYNADDVPTGFDVVVCP